MFFYIVKRQTVKTRSYVCNYEKLCLNVYKNNNESIAIDLLCYVFFANKLQNNIKLIILLLGLPNTQIFD